MYFSCCKKFKKWPRPLLRPKTNHTFHQKSNPSCGIVPLMSIYLLVRLQYPGHNFTYVAVHVTRKDISHSKHIQVYHCTPGIEPLPRVFGKFVYHICTKWANASKIVLYNVLRRYKHTKTVKLCPKIASSVHFSSAFDTFDLYSINLIII